MIDKIDIKILSEKKKKGDISYERLGKEVNLTKGAISKRIAKLKKEGIILGDHYFVNFDYFGLRQRIFLFVNVPAKSEVYLDIEKIPEIHRSYGVTGDCDVVLSAVVKDASSINRFIDGIDSVYGEDVRSITPIIVRKVYKEHGAFPPEVEPKKMDVKDTDKEILSKIQENPNKNKICRELSINRNTFYKRLSRLKGEGLLRPSIKIDYEKLFTGIVSVDTLPGCAEKVAKQLKHEPEVFSLYQVIGKMDLLVFAVAANARSYSELIIDKLRFTDKIRGTSTYVVMNYISKKLLVHPY